MFLFLQLVNKHNLSNENKVFIIHSKIPPIKKATTVFDNCLYLNFCKRKRQSISRLKSTVFPMSCSIFPSDNGIIYITPCKMQFRLVNTAFSAC